MSHQPPKTTSKKRKPVKKVSRDELFGEWIISYADTVTLLLCFFIIFYAIEKEKAENELIKELSLKFNENKSEDNNKGNKDFKTLGETLEAGISNVDGKKLQFEKDSKNNEILLRLYEKDFFEVGDFNLKEDGEKLILKISNILKPYQDKIFIRVEGHTDTLPVSKKAFYKTNLNLSSLRASEAAQVLLDNDFNEKRLRVLGYGSSRPLVKDRAVASNDEALGDYLPEKGMQNRRVELRIHVGETNLKDVIKFN